MAGPDNANPTIHAASGASRRTRKRAASLDLSDDDEWESRGKSLDATAFDDGVEQEIDGEEIFGKLRLGGVR